jgi:hypothetical protein
MAAEITAEQTWRLLWSRAACDIISALPSSSCYERIQVGAGWGLRSRSDRQRALLLHPSGGAREIGDLALTLLGHGTQVIPRCSLSYPEYLHEVADIVETSAGTYLEPAPADA